MMTHSLQRLPYALTLTLGLLACVPALADQPARIAAGSVHEGSVQTRNSAIQIGDDARVTGNIFARNGSVQIAERVTAGDIETRNGSITAAAAGQFGRIESRNGSISIGPDSQLADVSTRNGQVRLGPDTLVAGAVETRNGSIRLGEGAVVAGSMESRNGGIDLAQGSAVEADVTSRNGQIKLDQARVGRHVTSRGGDLSLLGGSEVGGNLIIEIDPNQVGQWRWFGRSQTSYPEAGDIRILDGSTVAGDVIVTLPSDYDREPPTVTIDAGSRVLGRVMVDARVQLNIEGEVQGGIERIEP